MNLKFMFRALNPTNNINNIKCNFLALKNVYPKVTLLLIAGFVSSFGTILTQIAFPLQVYEVTRSQLIFSQIVLIETIAMIISSIFIMGLIDQISPKKALIFANLFDGLLLFGLFLLEYFKIECHGYHFYAFALLSSLTTPIIIPSYIRLVSIIFKNEKEKVNSIASLNEIASSLSLIMGPMLSALLMQAMAPYYVFLLDSFTFLFAFFIFLTTKIDYQQLNQIKLTVKATFLDMKKGFSLAIKNSYVLIILIQQAFISFAYILIFSNVTFHLREVLKVSESTYSLIILFNGVGGFIGGFVNYSSTIKRNTKILISTILYAIAAGLYSIGYSPILIALAVLTINFGAVMARVNTRLAIYDEGDKTDGGKLVTFRNWTLMSVMLISSTISVNLATFMTTYNIFRIAFVSILISLVFAVYLAWAKKFKEK